MPDTDVSVDAEVRIRVTEFDAADSAGTAELI